MPAWLATIAAMLPSMKQRARGPWVVTGAASGFGRTFAQRIAAQGDPVALWDLNAAGLRETESMLGGARSCCVEVDVTDPEAVKRAATQTLESLGSVAHVIHSAGVLRVGPAEVVSPADYELMIKVNYLGSVHVAQALLPQLRDARGRSVLMFVASVAGLRGFPELAGYSASKFAVVGFSQALRDELHNTNVDVRVLCPPPGDTPMVRNLPKLPPIYKLSKMFSADQVVDAAMRGIEKRSWVLLVDMNSKAMERIGALMPGVLDRVIRFASR